MVARETPNWFSTDWVWYESWVSAAHQVPSEMRVAPCCSETSEPRTSCVARTVKGTE